MKKEIAERLVEASEKIDLGYSEDEPRIHENYSGRGMYGRTTTGITVSGWKVLAMLAAELAYSSNEEEHEELQEELRKLSWDSMGRDSIIIY